MLPPMQDYRTGARFRALRHRLGWRQVDLAMRAGVSQGVISLVERGRLEKVTIRRLRSIARELDAEFATHVRWRGGDLDRLADEAHARLVGRTVRLLQDHGWTCRVEVSYSVYGERGSIDILAWHETSRLLLVVEVKTELVSIEETLRKHDAKARLGAGVAARELGWRSTGTARLLVLPALATPRRRVGRHDEVLLAVYPLRGAEVRHWLTRPTAPAGGILFVDSGDNGVGTVNRKRIRGARSR